MHRVLANPLNERLTPVTENLGLGSACRWAWTEAIRWHYKEKNGGHRPISIYCHSNVHFLKI